MNVNGKFTTVKIYADTIEDGVIKQVKEISNCKAFENQTVRLMPDCHVGASGPVGLVSTIGDYVNPQHVGVDIGCTVSMILLDDCLNKSDYVEFEKDVKNNIPMGFNINSEIQFDKQEFLDFLTTKFNEYKTYWDVLNGLPDVVTEEWIEKTCKRLNIDINVFYNSLMSLGGGNHFLEYGETESGLTGFSIHCGSRNLGQKICNYWTKKTKKNVVDIKEFKNEYLKTHENMLNFNEDVKKFINSNRIEGYLSGENLKGYLCDMCLGQLYAEWNHKCIIDKVLQILEKFYIHKLRVITSVHNFIDLKDHILRKSAIRAYKDELMLVPFNMRDGIAVCEGLSNEDWLNSCAHGAGRKMSRSDAKNNVSMEEFENSMLNIYSTSINENTLDESPMAYKDTNEIINRIKETCKILFVVKPKISVKCSE